MLRTTLSGAARQDLSDVWEFIARDNPRAADKVLKEVSSTLELLVLNPEAGRLCHFKNPKLAGVYSYVIGQFHNYIVFYRFTGHTLEVVRLLHGARDIEALLER